MLILPESALHQIMQSLVMATHQLTDLKGKRHQVGTIDGPTLRSATLAALQVICGTPVDTVSPEAVTGGR